MLKAETITLLFMVELGRRPALSRECPEIRSTKCSDLRDLAALAT